MQNQINYICPLFYCRYLFTLLKLFFAYPYSFCLLCLFIQVFVSLTSGYPGLRSLQNGRASLLHYPPPSPKSREAERPGSRKAERRKPGKPGGRKGRNADWAEVRPDQTKPCVRISHIAGMPRCNTASLFSSQSFAFA